MGTTIKLECKLLEGKEFSLLFIDVFLIPWHAITLGLFNLSQALDHLLSESGSSLFILSLCWSTSFSTFLKKDELEVWLEPLHIWKCLYSDLILDLCSVWIYILVWKWFSLEFWRQVSIVCCVAAEKPCAFYHFLPLEVPRFFVFLVSEVLWGMSGIDLFKFIVPGI